MPDLYIITGSNGAGKSTLGFSYLPVHLQANIFDGDKLFMQKKAEFWQSGIKSTKECRNRAIKIVEDSFRSLVENALAAREDFAYEGHFTNDATWDIPKKFLEKGYTLTLIFFGLTRYKFVATSSDRPDKGRWPLCGTRNSKGQLLRKPGEIGCLLFALPHSTHI